MKPVHWQRARVMAGARLPRRVGPFRIKGRLGQGGMGTVYLGQHQSTLAAVKLLHVHLAADAAFRMRFRREVELAARVRGRWVAELLDADPDAPTPWLATRYVPGPTLESLVAAHGPLPGDQLLVFAAAVAEALCCIHQAGIVHRDLTPRNVLLDAEGPKVVDFGIAAANGLTPLTRTGMLVGTPGWLAPELIEGQRPTPAADIYGWGALTYFAATGHLPDGDTDMAQLPPGLKALVEAALDTQPDQRPTAPELLDALTADPAAGGSSTKTAATLPARMDTWVLPRASLPPALGSRHRHGWWAIVGIALLLAAASVLALLVMAAESPDTSTTQNADSPRAARMSGAGLPQSSDSDVEAAPFLPRFHDEFDRTVLTRPGHDAIVVLSRPRRPEPRPVVVTLLEWDRGRYELAQQLEFDCGYLSSAEFDDASLIYLDCHGGATASSLWAIEPRSLELIVHPHGTDDAYFQFRDGWLHSGWERVQRPERPDDLVLYHRYCEPDCSSGGHVTHHLRWDASFRWWQAVLCTLPDGTVVPFEHPHNASADRLLEPLDCPL